MTESNKIQEKKEQMRLEKLSRALKQNLNRRKNVNEKNANIKEEKNIAES